METINGNELEMKIFHVCIKGHGSITIFADDEDYRVSINYMAIAQYKSNVRILAYCQMPNHSHFVIEADAYDDIKYFLSIYKRQYSMHFCRKYNESKIFKRQEALIKKINSIQYLRLCIAYVLRNPLVAGLIKTTDYYPWTSHACYFRENDKSMTESYTIESLTKRRIREILKTRLSLKECRYNINQQETMIEPKSFVAYRCVEKIFNDSAPLFSKYFGWNDDKKIEYELVIKQKYRYDDIEMKSISDIISMEKFRKPCSELLPEQKRELAFNLFKRYKTTAAQLSRVLRIRAEALQ